MPKGVGRKVHGLFTAIITPFDRRGRVDSDSFWDLVRFQISKGSEGIYPCGSTGLGPLLKTEERKVVAETAVRATAGEVPVVVQVGSADTESTVELAKHAEKIGAVAVASLTPYYYKLDERAVIRRFEDISKAVAIPVLAYNIPQFTGYNIQSSTLSALAKAGTLSGIKDSCRDILHFLDLLASVPDEFVVMNGTEEYGLFAIMSGADGLVSGGASALPELFKTLVSAQRKGDYKRAQATQQAVQMVKDLVRVGPIAAYYAILKERGMDCGAPRPPFLPLEEADRRRIIKGLKDLSLI